MINYNKLQNIINIYEGTSLDVKFNNKKTEESIHQNNKLPESKTLKDFTKYSRDVNSALYDKHLKGEVTKDNIHAIPKIHQLDKEFLNTKTDKDMTVYAGLHKSPERHFENVNTDTTKIHIPSFRSTSSNFQEAAKFAYHTKAANKEKHSADNKDAPNLNKNSIGGIDPDSVKHILKIHVTKGTKAGSTKHFSEHPSENEILLARGHNMEIHRNPTILKNGTHIWHAKIVDHSPSKI